MHAHGAIVDLAPVAIVLPTRPHRFAAAFGNAGLVHAPDGLGMCVLASHDLLAAISQFLFIPLDRFQETLQGAGTSPELQGDGLGRLTMQGGKLPLDINLQQRSRLKTAKTIGKQSQKRSQLPSQPGNLLKCHPDGPPWSLSDSVVKRGGSSFSALH